MNGRETVEVCCASCGVTFQRDAANLRYRQRRFGDVPVFCSQKCFGLSRRDGKPLEVKRAAKRAYDAGYRNNNAAALREKKRRYYVEVRKADQEHEREVRARRMPYHVEYCRRYYADPEKKAAKVRYDVERRAAEYGPFAAAWKLLLELEREIRRLTPDRYERYKAKGYFQRTAQQRRRDAGIERSR